MARNGSHLDRLTIERLTRINLRNADINRRNQECGLMPILLAFTAMGFGAALFASALAFFKLVGV